VPGGGGELEVTVDGKLVYSKKQTGRFPEAQELLALLPE
jgi:selT/selW/selH-like putative selenoprotein